MKPYLLDKFQCQICVNHGGAFILDLPTPNKRLPHLGYKESALRYCSGELLSGNFRWYRPYLNSCNEVSYAMPTPVIFDYTMMNVVSPLSDH